MKEPCWLTREECLALHDMMLSQYGGIAGVRDGFNRRYERTGTLWEGRYRSALVDSGQYFLACSRYIELNRARGVDARADDRRTAR